CSPRPRPPRPPPSRAPPHPPRLSPLAPLLHQLRRCSGVFGFCHRHDRFGPRVAAGRGFTPPSQLPRQLSPGILPQSVHELSVLLALPIVRAVSRRSRFGLSVAPPFGLECLTSLAVSYGIRRRWRTYALPLSWGEYLYSTRC